MTHLPGLRILMAKDTVAGVGIYRGTLVPSLCVSAENVVAPKRRCAKQGAAS